jgi:carboxymethylenebutenolidase
MTPAIAQAMRKLQRIWEQHRDAILVRGDPDVALANTVPVPSVRHIPAMTGAAGRDDLRRFYAEYVLPCLPADLALTPVSRTVGRLRLVDEVAVSFTHDRVLPWLLPDIEPRHREVEVQAVAIAAYERGLLSSVRVHWDHATLLAQLGCLDGVAAR